MTLSRRITIGFILSVLSLAGGGALASEDIAKPAPQTLTVRTSTSQALDFVPAQQGTSAFHLFFLESPFANQVGDPSEQTHEVSFTLPADRKQERWGTPISESAVFSGIVRHRWTGPQLASFDLGVGRGGQGYSLLVDWYGEQRELFPPQYQPDLSAPWIDEVLQFVAVDFERRQQDPPPFSHQAGTYMRDGLETPFFSPILARGNGPYRHSLVSVNWAQQAHIPHNYRSNLITYAMYRSLGDGIIEVSYSVYNFDDSVKSDRFNLPWMAVRTSTLPNAHMVQGGGYLGMNWNFGGEPIIDVNNTDGWMFFSELPPASEEPNLSLGVVFGNQAADTTDWRGGRAADSSENSGTKDRNTTVGTVRKFVDLERGETMFYRYYLVVGPLDRVKAQVRNHNLVQKTHFQIARIQAGDSLTVNWSWNGQSVVSGSGDMELTLWAFPVEESFPVFLMEGTNGELLSTTDPYLDDPNDEYIKNYRSGFKVKQLLGYSDVHVFVRYR